MPFNLFLASLRDYFTSEHPPTPTICTCSPPGAQWGCGGVMEVMEKWRMAVVSHTPNRMGLSGREGVRVEFCFRLEAQLLYFCCKQDSHMLTTTTPTLLNQPPWCCMGGVRGRGPVLDWHVVGMSLTSQGSGENKPDSPHHHVYDSFVRCLGEPTGPPAGGQGNKTTAWRRKQGWTLGVKAHAEWKGQSAGCSFTLWRSSEDVKGRLNS